MRGNVKTVIHYNKSQSLTPGDKILKIKVVAHATETCD